jgi:hypothetical protein
MFSMNLIGINTILGLAGVVIALCAALMAFLVSRSNRRLRLRCGAVESSLAAMRRELELLSSISLKTGRRVKRLEKEQAGIADRVDLIELRGSPSFDQAIDSARRGTDPGRLTRQFGLSRGEADLVTRLHGRKKTA